MSWCAERGPQKGPNNATHDAHDATQDPNGHWALAANQSALGTDYAALTGQTNLPDLRGMFLRAPGAGTRIPSIKCTRRTACCIARRYGTIQVARTSTLTIKTCEKFLALCVSVLTMSLASHLAKTESI